MPWNYGDILDAVADAMPPAAPALIHNDRVTAWGEASRRMNNLGRALLARGVTPGNKVAFYLRNCSEYVEAMGACYRARLVHVNVNYRYTPVEVCYILDNSDAAAVIYGSEFRDALATIQDRLPKIRTYVEVAASDDVANWAQRYEDLAAAGAGERLDVQRSPDDMLFIYTGGTTGMPKGVMWRTGDLCSIWHDRLRRVTGSVPPTIEAFAAGIKAGARGPVTLPACPLMHGTGFIGASTTLLSGGTIVTVDNRAFDPSLIWAAVEKHKVQGMAVVGDPFAKPLLKALDEQPGRYDLSSMATMTSSGAMWSLEVKRGLLRHMPQITITDSFASTEAMGMGASVMTKDGETRTGTFQLLENAIVVDDDGRPVAPGGTGMVALGGPLPVGYYKDPAKSENTFRRVGDRRYAIPGDWARVETDGTITLLGRGSHCINTAGEKVFPEEVEEVLKTHASVHDALVVGVADEKWGQAVTGVVRLADGAMFDEQALRAHVRERLTGFKVPKRIVVAEVGLRAPNGKADYSVARAIATEQIEPVTINEGTC